MLSADQLNVSQQLEESGKSSSSSNDQKVQVTSINELLQILEDKAQYEQLITSSKTASPDLSFISLCRQRLIKAQQKSLQNYELRRASRTKRVIMEHTEDTDAPVTSVTEEPASLEQNSRESKSEQITQVLQRMHEMAQAEVSKGESNISELDMSSRTLRELQEKYSGVDILLNGSKRLVQILDSADKWDRRCIQASLGFLAFVMCYIVYRRILSGPIKSLLWSLFKLVGIAKLFDTRKSGSSGLNSSAVASVLEMTQPTITPRVGGIDTGHSITFSPHADDERIETYSPQSEPFETTLAETRDAEPLASETVHSDEEHVPEPTEENSVQTPERLVETPESPIETSESPVKTSESPVQTPEASTIANVHSES